MAWLFVHTAGPLMLRYKAGHWVAELRGERFGRWPRPEDGAIALHRGATGARSWDTRADCAAVPAELQAWRQTYDGWEDTPAEPRQPG